MSSTLIKNGTIVTASGERKADVLIEGGIIKKIETGLTGDEVIDATGKLIFPGLIDCHVHFREPGLEHKETLATGAASALAGGVTTVCEMPNTNPPAVTIAGFTEKVRRLKSVKDPVDIRFFFGATEPQHLIAFRKIWLGEEVYLRELRAKCCGLKLYLDHSTGNQKASSDVIDAAFKLCADLGAVAVCHCEDPGMNQEARSKYHDSADIADHSRMRPPESEERSIKDALAIAKKYGTHVHVAHLSTGGGLDLVRSARKAGVTVTCEVAPHHLFLTVEDYQTLGTLVKMNPPLRTRDHQKALWAGVADGTVDCISTDHAPHTLEEKKSHDVFSAPSGVPGVETMVPLLLSVAACHWPHPVPHSTIDFSLSTIVRLCFENPNRIFNLGKQGIEEGARVDLILVDPNSKCTIHAKELHSKCGWTPFEGWKIQGKVLRHIS